MRKILFTPFERYAGGEALTAGLIFALLAALGAVLFSTRFDGVLDAHFVTGEVTVATAIIDQSVNLLSAFTVFYLLAYLMGARGMRAVDMAGTLSAARAPYVLMPLLNINDFMSRHNASVAEGIAADPLNPDLELLIPLIPAIFFSLILVVWMIALMFNAWKVCTNFKKGKLIGGFIAALILSELISVVILSVIH